MPKKLKLVFMGISSFLVVLVFILSVQQNNRTFADEVPVIITTTPESVLFEVTNMKPGDWADRELTIQNRGEEDFSYHMIASRNSGSEKLYNVLELELQNADGDVLYEGSLGDFTGFDPRPLQALHEEDFSLTVYFPTHLGNDYQGLEVEVEFLFIAEGELPEVVDGISQTPIDDEVLEEEPEDGHILPATATNSYNYLVVGFIVLIAGSAMYFWNRKKSIKVE
ncbi:MULTISPECIES: LPXTG cell wall anchor domain-containing protein [Bacillaceae]|uniref:LPXTG cell wall anchor domain-containing protein n=1 Tax=Evansella alkalicola TaxID=745819 RepID=A0ABS6JV48_9BACI|nr:MULTISPECIES: LPXTG cell wall anchor domain-containing protein [Bacillaceae]MBU9722450.1 LPXTG cell wall anchor domain-containing protein [Bacillus alkalicola]